MRIGLVSSASPLVGGGYRTIVEGLAPVLREAGHEVEVIWVPTADEPDSIFAEMAVMRLMDLESYCDRVITFRPPAHVVRHPNKIVWFIHHLRVYYDLWETTYCPVPHTTSWRAFRERLIEADTRALAEADRIYTNSGVVSDRLRRYNGLKAEILYPPLPDASRFYNRHFGDEIVSVCRLERHKRPDLLIEAMKRVRSPVRLRLAGEGSEPRFVGELQNEVTARGLQARVRIDPRWISEEEKIDLIADALAVAYVPLDEDSYGYPTLEAAHALKPVVSVTDGGGVAEFIVNGETGFISAPDPQALAEAFDRLWSDKKEAARLGAGCRARVDELEISWTRVVDRLTS
jgi:glycosyltransferase involved in cell wall biosynthesis